MIYKISEFPNYEKIIELEKKSFKDSSCISNQDLIGKWKFQYVWKKGSTNVDNISSSLLQVLGANLELSNNLIARKDNILGIKNSIRFGVISISFQGEAFLKGKRPLLLFSFNKLVVKVGNFDLFNLTLKNEDENKMPFFSLIAIDEFKNWMCARGKGGGLAIWIKT